MNNLEALMAECEPFTISSRVANKALVDTGLSAIEDYSNKVEIAKAAVVALSRFLTLKSEGEGAFSQSFDSDGLKARIKNLCAIGGLNASEYLNQVTVSDGSNRW